MVGLFLAGSTSIVLVTMTWTTSVVLAGFVIIGVAAIFKLGTPVNPGPPLSEMVKFGLSSLPGHISILDTFRIDQLVVGVLAGPAALGLYVVASAFGNLPRFVAQSVGMVAYPKLASSSENTSKRSLASS